MRSSSSAPALRSGGGKRSQGLINLRSFDGAGRTTAPWRRAADTGPADYPELGPIEFEANRTSQDLERSFLHSGVSRAHTTFGAGRPGSPHHVGEHIVRLYTGSLSPPTDFENERGAMSHSVLSALAKRRPGGLQRQTTTTNFSVKPQGFEDFAENANQLASSLDQLRVRHQAFEGQRIERGTKAVTSSKKLNKDTEHEDAERRAERLESYKMCRSIEPELPPLVLIASPSDVATCRDMDIVRRNKSPDVVLSWAMGARDHLVKAKFEHDAQRRDICYQACQELQMVQHQRWEEAVIRKRLQADRAKKMKKNQPTTVSTEETFDPTGWFKAYAVHAFARTIYTDVVSIIRGRGVETTGQPIAPASVKQSAASSIALRAIHMRETKSDPRVTRVFALLSVCFKRKLEVKRQRQAAKIMCSSLLEWRSSGRFFVSMQKFLEQIRTLQAWWRSCSRRLRELRDKLSRRWVQLEREALMRELQLLDKTEADKAEKERVTKGGKKRATTTKEQLRLSMEDRIDISMVEEPVRIRFIENELRARRYMSLPAIALWEEQLAQWHAGLMSMAEDTAINDVLRIEKKNRPPEMIGFCQWPPVRPSYVPGAHPQAEARGARCGPSCPGVKGDEEVRAMWRVARRHPHGGGWKEIPVARTQVPTCAARPSVKSSSYRQSSKRKVEASKARFFPDAPDEELDRLGLGPQGLPGSDGPKGIRVAGDGEIGRCDGVAPPC